MFMPVFNSLVALLVCMAAGFLCRKLQLINDQVSAGLTGILVKITLPCTVFMSMQRPFSRALLIESGVMLGISFALFATGICIGAVLARYLHASPGEKGIWQFVLTFSNVGYMGFPMMLAVYGEDALLYTSMANVAFNVLAFTVGIQLLSKGHATGRKAAGNVKAILLNPAIVATCIGFIFFILSLSLPQPVQTGVSMIGGMTSPLSMLVVGGILAKSDFKQVFAGSKMYAVIFLRLIVIPVVSFFILRPFLTNRMMLGVAVFMLAMPAASLTVIFAEQYGADSVMSSKLVFVSTILSLLTIPVISLLL